MSWLNAVRKRELPRLTQLSNNNLLFLEAEKSEALPGPYCRPWPSCDKSVGDKKGNFGESRYAGSTSPNDPGDVMLRQLLVNSLK